jgi:transposase
MKHKSSDYKQSVVQYYLVSDENQEKVCKIFGCSPRSLLRWVEKYKKDGEIKREDRKPITYKVKKEYVKFILHELKVNKTITINELFIKLKEKYNIELSLMHIHRIIRDNNITLKLTRIRHEPNKRFGKDININEKLDDFYK